MNRFSKNKEIVNTCKNYYKIINSNLYIDDKASLNLIRLYRDYIFEIETVTKREKEKLTLVDNIMYKFVTDNKFKKEMLKKLSAIKISKSVIDIKEYVMNKLIEYFEDYKDTITRNIYIPRWI